MPLSPTDTSARERPDQEKAVLDSVPKQLLIGGRWRDASGGKTLPVEDPATGETIAEVADATPDDAVAALDAAHAKQAEWAEHPPRERGEILRGAFELMNERKADLALLMTLEMGKAVKESETEVAYASEFFRWFAEQAVRIDGRFQVAPTGQGRLLVMKQPVGPCYLITPWNFPAAMATRKIGPAVAAGCTMILKPASSTPLSALALAQILEEAGLPAGVLNVITSSQLECRDQAAAVRLPAAQAQLHRLHRGGAQARRAVGGEPAASVDGAGRQRALPGVRGRRSRRRSRGRDDRQDAQHRRGVHRRQPDLRRREHRPGVHRAPGRADVEATRRPRHRGWRRRRPAGQRGAAREGRGAGQRRGPARRAACDRWRPARRAGGTSSSPPC